MVVRTRALKPIPGIFPVRRIRLIITLLIQRIKSHVAAAHRGFRRWC